MDWNICKGIRWKNLQRDSLESWVCVLSAWGRMAVSVSNQGIYRGWKAMPSCVDREVQKHFCYIGLSLPEQRIHDCPFEHPWVTWGRGLLSWEWGLCEENLGAKWWIFSGWGGTVSGRIDAFPPEERMQRRDLQLEEADVYWSTYQSIWTLCTSTCESLRRTWLPLCSTPAGIEPRENIRQTPNEEYTLKKQWGTVFLNVMVIKIKISCSDITNKCST